MSVTRKIYQKNADGNFIEVADIGALAQYVLFEELNDTNQPATAVEIVKRLREELSDAITTEANTRTTEDGKLQTAIDKEIADRGTAVSGEKSARESAVSTLQTNIDNEKTARENGDTSTLSNAKTYADGKITQEVTDRNTAISNAISQEVTDRNTAISNAMKKNGSFLTELNNTNSDLRKALDALYKS